MAVVLMWANPTYAQLSISGMPLSVCGTTSFNVQLSGAFQGNAGNQFKIELSDTLGSFGNPLVIGQLNASQPGNVSCTIPASQFSGVNYRIRVVSTNPAFTSTPGLNTLVYHAPFVPQLNPSGQIALCGSAQLIMFTNNRPYIQWFRNGTPIPGAVNPVLQVSQTGTYLVRSGASASCNFQSLPTVVIQGSLPSVNQVSGPLKVCPGMTVNLTTQDQIIEWRLNGSPIAGAMTVLQANQPGQYRALVQSQSGCNALSNPHTLLLDTTPVNNISVIQGQLCVNQQAVFSGGSSALFEWFIKTPFGQGPVLSTMPNFSFSPSNLGLYPPLADSLCLRLTGFNGCVSLDCFKDTIGFVPPRPSIIRNGNNLISTNLNGNAWHQVNNGFIPGALNRNFTPVNSGSYYVVTIDPVGCKSPNSDTISVIYAGLNNIKSDNHWEVYPIPANGYFQVKSDSYNQKEALFELFDTSGRRVKSWQIQEGNIETTIFSTEGLNPAMYWLNIRQGDNQTSVRILIR